jgi:hypothetical protein
VKKKKQIYWIILGVFLMLAYILLAAQPVPVELLIQARWISSLETGISEPGIQNSPPGQPETES